MIPVLVELLRKEDGHSAMSKQAKQAAVVALSNLSACPSCKVRPTPSTTWLSPDRIIVPTSSWP